MRVHLNKLLIVAFLGYVSYEIHTLYSFCQPTVAGGAIGSDKEGVVAWDLSASPPLDVSLFLSLSRSSARPWLAEGTRSHVLLGRFSGITPSGEASIPALLVNQSLPQNFYQNQTLYLHVAVSSPQQADREKGLKLIRHTAVKISRFVQHAKHAAPTRHLLSEPASVLDERKVVQPKPQSSIPRLIEVGFVQEVRPLVKKGLQEKGLGEYVHGKELRLPLFVNTLVSPRDEYMPLLKENVSEVGGDIGMIINFRNIGVAYWTMQLQIGQAFDEAEKVYGMNEYDIDSFKQMIGGSSAYKILAVYGVAILHLVFSYLAFASDINFWRKKTSFEGLSSSSVAMQAGIDFIMFHYVQEQKKTRFVLYFIGFRFLLQVWKLRKLTTFERSASWPFVRWVNRDSAKDADGEEMHDMERTCMRRLFMVLIPVVLAFCGYRLVRQPFESWYSWLVLSLAVCAQVGGFVAMTPQVFMNYRLKSVEHLPWRALTYQAVNTFIDDIFMFCIRMPEVQKYSCFRDDIIFVICCYQRWSYRKARISPEDCKPEGDGAGGGVAGEPSQLRQKVE